ncbi:MAG: hypothetical protein GEU73_14740 [Chloroflexi bacterium]|nr:hypothetical protein [Chloroflexota bacterium]
MPVTGLCGTLLAELQWLDRYLIEVWRRSFVGMTATTVTDSRRSLHVGPERLLARVREMIDRGRLDIGQVRLSSVLDWLLDAVRRDGRDSIGEVCAVLETAARLAVLKARRLSSSPEPVEEEERLPVAAPLPELPLWRGWLMERIAGGPWTFAGPVRVHERMVPPLETVRPRRLCDVMTAVLARRRAAPGVLTPRVIRVSIEHSSTLILERVSHQGHLCLRDVAGDTRDGHVAAFLACLILTRQGRVSLTQDTLFGEVVVRAAAQPLAASA